MLLLSDLRQDARIGKVSGRARRSGRYKPYEPVDTEVHRTRLYRGTPVWRKVLSLFEMGAITVAVGAFIGTAIGVILTLGVLLLRTAVK